MRQLLAKDKWGNNPLHAACYHKPPIEIISGILKVASLLSSNPYQIHTIKNDNECTPLIIACISGASRQVIEELLRPSCTSLVDGGLCVTEGDKAACTVFSGLLSRYEINQLIPAFQKEYLPLEFATVAFEDCPISSRGNPLANTSHVNLLNAVSTNYQSGRTSERPSLLFQNFSKSVVSLIQAAWWSCDERGEVAREMRATFHSMVHAAACVSEMLPTKMTNLFLQEYPEMVASRHNNDCGLTDPYSMSSILPLHLAITTNEVQRTSNLAPRLVFQRAYFIEQLLLMDPSSACQPVPGSGNRSALCQAIASGLTWYIPPLPPNKLLEEQRVTGMDPTTMEHGPLQRLWKCNPEALYEPDPITGLYPFMLATSGGAETDKEGNQNIDYIYQLDTVYHLLRLYPQVIC